MADWTFDQLQVGVDRSAADLTDLFFFIDNKNIVCWHISNEYGGECYCENCAKAFRVWLKDKYKTLDEVNKAWNMEFWGHTIYDWDEIVPPNDLGDGMPWGSGTAFA